MKIRFLNRILDISLLEVPDLITSGITNETKENLFVPFLDYDGVAYEVVKKDLQHIAKLFNLSGFIICASSEEVIETFDKSEKLHGHYQVYGWDCMEYHEHLDMLKHTRCDPQFVKVAPHYALRNWVLRITEKENLAGEKVRISPKFKEALFFKNNKRIISTGFIDFYKMYFLESEDEVVKSLNKFYENKKDYSTLADIEPITYGTYSMGGKNENKFKRLMSWMKTHFYIRGLKL
jgi:hypothetical protein